MTKTWDEMMPREQDRLVAETLGYTIYHYDKDYRENCYYMLMDPAFNPVVSGREGERKTEGEAWEDAPAFTTDHNACRLVEDEIERRGLRYYRLLALYRTACDAPDMQAIRTLHFTECWYMILASPDQRCRAALRAMGVEV